MSIAITEDHRALGQTASDFLAKHDSRGAARALLEAETETLPPFWGDLASLGWLGLHLPEARGGSGFGLPELVVVVEELGRAVTPGPFVPTVIASAVIDAVGSDELAARLLPGLADGSVLGGVGARRPTSRCRDGRAAGTAPAVLGGGLAHVLVLPAGDDAIVVDAGGGRRDGRRAGQPRPDPAHRPGDARRCAGRGDPRGAAGAGRPGPPPRGRRGHRRRHRVHRAGRRLRQGARAVRPAHRHVPGRQAPLRQHARRLRAGHRGRVGRRPRRRGGRRPALATPRPWRPRSPCRPATSARSSTSRCTAASASPGSTTPTCISAGPPRSRRSSTPRPPPATSPISCAAACAGTRTIDLPPEAEPMRDEVRAFAERVQGLDAAAQREAMIETGYVMPHWPKPWGRDAGAVEQLVIEQEFKAAGVHAPAVRHHGVGDPHADPARHRGPGRPLGDARPAPGRHLVPALQRARRRQRRRRGQDAGHAGRRRLAGQRPEGVDERRPLRRLRPGHHPHRSRRPQARGHHDHGHRPARRGRGGAPAQDGHRAVGVQRGLLQRRLRARRRRGGPRQRRLDRGPGDARQRERVHRRRPGRA